MLRFQIKCAPIFDIGAASPLRFITLSGQQTRLFSYYLNVTTVCLQAFGDRFVSKVFVFGSSHGPSLKVHYSLTFSVNDLCTQNN